MTICREWLLVKHQGSTASAEPLRCRSWSCEYCAPDRRKRLIAQAIGGLPNTFITLTVKPKIGESPTTRARSLVYAWREIRRKASNKHRQIDWWHLVEWMEHEKWRHKQGRPRTKQGLQHPDNGTIPFLAVFERHKSGEPHLHILCRSEWIPQKWLSDEMRRLTGAFIVDVRRTYSPSECAAYCTKYVGKDPAIYGNCKRYWASQDYELDPPAKDDERDNDGVTFEVYKGDLHDWTTEQERLGRIVQPSPKGWYAWDPRLPQVESKGSFVRDGAPPPGEPPDRTGQASALRASTLGRS
jgi:hypothetical protein